MIKKAVKGEAKTGLQSASYIKKMDYQALQGNRLAHITVAKVETQGTAIKDLIIENP